MKVSGAVLHRIWTLFLMAFLVLFLAGNKACREDFDFGSQASLTEDDDETEDDSEDEDEDEDEVVTVPTSTPTASPTPAATPTATPTTAATPTATPTPDTAASRIESEGVSAVPVFRELQHGTNKSQGSNWLGNQFNEEGERSRDSDRDGYTDYLEKELGTDEHSADSFPQYERGDFRASYLGIDDDLDGLKNEEEHEFGTDFRVADTDGDGVYDGAEYLSETDPLNAEDLPVDRDGDGLSDSYEELSGTRADKADSDSDALRDDFELALGTDPLNIDTDRDGILDGKEVELGLSPLG